MFLQTIRGNKLENKDIIKNNRTPKGEARAFVFIRFNTHHLKSKVNIRNLDIFR
jgi:hypothetical protein